MHCLALVRLLSAGRLGRRPPARSVRRATAGEIELNRDVADPDLQISPPQPEVNKSSPTSRRNHPDLPRH